MRTALLAIEFELLAAMLVCSALEKRTRGRSRERRF